MRNDTEGALGQYLRAISAHKFLVACATLATLIGCVLWLAIRSPGYEANTEILVTPLPQDDSTFLGLQFLRDSGEPTRTMQTAATLVGSTRAAQVVARRLKTTTTAVEEAVTVEPKGESDVLEVRAVSDSPRVAARLANEFALASLAVRKETLQREVASALRRLEERQREAGARQDPAAAAELTQRISALEAVRDGSDPTLSISEPATQPKNPLGAPDWLALALSTMAGLVLGTGLAVASELTERRVRDEDELTSIYPLPILTRVPVLSRREIRRSSGGRVPAVSEAFRTLQAQLEVRGETRRTIMLTSPSSNDGKTTSVLNLAINLVESGNRVIVIDFDLRKPEIAERLDIETTNDLVAMLSPDTLLDDLLVEDLHSPGLEIVPAAGTGGDASLLDALIRKLPVVLEQALEIADYVIIDTPPLGEVSDALKIAHLVDDILIVARPGNTNRVNLEHVRDLLEAPGLKPAGMVVIGERPGASTGYYAYGQPTTKRRAAGERQTARSPV
ncbi:MAG TPA: AAA family ATPase [Solirubrobacteraceae bacterium]|nr:AAA family ATPase [Solirubrobacteraceae bacterium]